MKFILVYKVKYRFLKNLKTHFKTNYPIQCGQSLCIWSSVSSFKNKSRLVGVTSDKWEIVYNSN